MRARFIFVAILFTTIIGYSIGCEHKQNFTIGVLPPNNASYEMQGGHYDLYDLKKYGFVAYFFETPMDMTSITLSNDNFIFSHVRDGQPMGTLIDSVFSGIRWTKDDMRMMLDIVEEQAFDAIVNEGDQFIITLHSHKTAEDETATGSAIIRFIYTIEDGTNPYLKFISPISKADYPRRFKNKYRLPPHGLTKIEFTDPSHNGAIFFIGTLKEQVPDDLEFYNTSWLPYDNLTDNIIYVITLDGWDIDTEYSVLFLSERPRLHERADSADRTFLSGESFYYIKLHALQDESGAPFLRVKPDGDPIQLDGGYFAQTYAPDKENETDSYELLFVTSRVRIDIPQPWNYSLEFPNSVSGICKGVNTFDIVLISNGLYSNPETLVSGASCDNDIGIPGIKGFDIPLSPEQRPTDDGYYEIKAVVSSALGGDVGDFDIVTTVLDNTATPPIVEIEPDFLCNETIPEVTLRITGEPGATVKVYFELDSTIVKESTFELPPAYSYEYFSEKQIEELVNVEDLTPATYIVYAEQIDPAGNIETSDPLILIISCPPVITSEAQTIVMEGELYSYDIDCMDAGDDTLLLGIGASNTCDGVLDDNGDGTGNYSFTPDESQGGSWCDIQINCSNSYYTTSQTSTVSIVEDNQAPTWNPIPSNISVHLGDSYNQNNGHADDLDTPNSSPGDPGYLTCSNAGDTCSFDVTVNGTGAGAVDCNISFTSSSQCEICSVRIQVTDGDDRRIRKTVLITNARTLYVNENAEGTPETGLSWEYAFKHPQDAMDVACEGDQVWVAEGTYKASNTNATVLTMAYGVYIYGGFKGDETSLNERSWITQKTILDGDYDNNDTHSANDSYHVVLGSSYSRLDGFTIEGGYAYGDDPYSETLSSNWGAGFYNYYNYRISGLTISNCVFTNNSAIQGGGGIGLMTADNIVIENTIIENNYAYNYGGGGIYIWDNISNKNIHILNSIIHNNEAYDRGGSIHNRNSYVAITNCTFSDNAFISLGVQHGVAISNDDGNVMLSNSIMWDNGTEISNRSGSIEVTYSDIGGGYAGFGNINADPLFVGGGNYSLQEDSPAIDKGTNLGAPAVDITGYPRPGGALWDMGAYEYQSSEVCGITITCPTNVIETAAFNCAVLYNNSLCVDTLSLATGDTCTDSEVDDNGDGTGTYSAPAQGEAAGPGSCTAAVEMALYALSDTATITIDEVNQAPILTNLPATETGHWGDDDNLNAIVTDADLPAQNITWSLSNDTCSFTNEISLDGEVSWTCDDVETCSVDVTATDDFTTPASATETLTIQCDNTAPVITSSAPTSVVENMEYIYDFTCTDADGDDLIFEVVEYYVGDYSCGGSLDGTGTYSFTPDDTKGGTICFVEITCTDTIATATEGPIVVNIEKSVIITSPSDGVFIDTEKIHVAGIWQGTIDENNIDSIVIKVNDIPVVDAVPYVLYSTPNLFDAAITAEYGYIKITAVLTPKVGEQSVSNSINVYHSPPESDVIDLELENCDVDSGAVACSPQPVSARSSGVKEFSLRVQEGRPSVIYDINPPMPKDSLNKAILIKGGELEACKGVNGNTTSKICKFYHHAKNIKDAGFNIEKVGGLCKYTGILVPGFFDGTKNYLIVAYDLKLSILPGVCLVAELLDEQMEVLAKMNEYSKNLYKGPHYQPESGIFNPLAGIYLHDDGCYNINTLKEWYYNIKNVDSSLPVFTSSNEYVNMDVVCLPGKGTAAGGTIDECLSYGAVGDFDYCQTEDVTMYQDYVGRQWGPDEGFLYGISKKYRNVDRYYLDDPSKYINFMSLNNGNSGQAEAGNIFYHPDRGTIEMVDNFATVAGAIGHGYFYWGGHYPLDKYKGSLYGLYDVHLKLNCVGTECPTECPDPCPNPCPEGGCPEGCKYHYACNYFTDLDLNNLFEDAKKTIGFTAIEQKGYLDSSDVKRVPATDPPLDESLLLRAASLDKTDRTFKGVGVFNRRENFYPDSEMNGTEPIGDTSTNPGMPQTKTIETCYADMTYGYVDNKFKVEYSVNYYALDGTEKSYDELDGSEESGLDILKNYQIKAFQLYTVARNDCALAAAADPESCNLNSLREIYGKTYWDPTKGTLSSGKYYEFAPNLEELAGDKLVIGRPDITGYTDAEQVIMETFMDNLETELLNIYPDACLVEEGGESVIKKSVNKFPMGSGEGLYSNWLIPGLGIYLVSVDYASTLPDFDFNFILRPAYKGVTESGGTIPNGNNHHAFGLNKNTYGKEVTLSDIMYLESSEVYLDLYKSVYVTANFGTGLRYTTYQPGTSIPWHRTIAFIQWREVADNGGIAYLTIDNLKIWKTDSVDEAVPKDYGFSPWGGNIDSIYFNPFKYWPGEFPLGAHYDPAQTPPEDLIKYDVPSDFPTENFTISGWYIPEISSKSSGSYTLMDLKGSGVDAGIRISYINVDYDPDDDPLCKPNVRDPQCKSLGKLTLNFYEGVSEVHTHELDVSFAAGQPVFWAFSFDSGDYLFIGGSYGNYLPDATGNYVFTNSFSQFDSLYLGTDNSGANPQEGYSSQVKIFKTFLDKEFIIEHIYKCGGEYSGCTFSSE